MTDFSKTLKKLESISKIKLTDAERKIALEFFESSVQKFDTLENIDTENTEPLISPFSLTNIMREDIAYKTISTDVILENAPEHQDGYFVVPRILE